MTTFRFSFWAAVACLLSSSVGLAQAGKSQAQGAWESYWSKSEGIWKLLYLPAGSIHGDIYFRCRPSENWVFLIEDAPPNPEGNLIVQVGNVSVQVSSQVEADEMGSYTEGVLPLTSPLLQSLPGASSFMVNGRVYPIRSFKDKAAISDFLSGCRSRGL